MTAAARKSPGRPAGLRRHSFSEALISRAAKVAQETGCPITLETPDGKKLTVAPPGKVEEELSDLDRWKRDKEAKKRRALHQGAEA